MDIKQTAQAYATNPTFAAEAKEKYTELLSRSATDRAFRDKLVSNPRAAIAEFSGHEVSESFNVVFVENSADATIVLPDPVWNATELSEEELETVAGGSTPACAIATVVASALWVSAEIVSAIADHMKSN
jgi:hypothetical protein